MCRWMNCTHNKNSHNASYGPLTRNTRIKHSKTETHTHIRSNYGYAVAWQKWWKLVRVLNIAAVPFQRDTVDTCHTHTNTYPQCLTFTLHYLPLSSIGFRRPSCSPLHLKLQSKREGAKTKACYAGKSALILYQSVCLTTWRPCIMQPYLATIQKETYCRHTVHAIYHFKPINAHQSHSFKWWQVASSHF